MGASNPHPHGQIWASSSIPTLITRDQKSGSFRVEDAAGRFALAVLGDDYLVDLELTALEAEGRGEIVSTPRVITANQKEAKIEQGVEIPYQQAASSGATTIQFKKAVLSLTVTPQITPDNNIIMDLRVHKDNVGDIISTGGLGGTVPSIDTRAVETQVLVKDGQTVVLGGIYETERRETVNSSLQVTAAGLLLFPRGLVFVDGPHERLEACVEDGQGLGKFLVHPSKLFSCFC